MTEYIDRTGEPDDVFEREVLARVEHPMTPVPSSPVALLDQLDELRANATPGPWVNSEAPREYVAREGKVWSATVPDGFDDTVAETVEPADAALIVAAVNAVGPLTAAVRAVLELCNTAERDVSELLGLRAGLRIASNVGSDDIRTALTAALSVTP